jgi:hypothetical protein
MSGNSDSWEGGAEQVFLDGLRLGDASTIGDFGATGLVAVHTKIFYSAVGDAAVPGARRGTPEGGLVLALSGAHALDGWWLSGTPADPPEHGHPHSVLFGASPVWNFWDVDGGILAGSHSEWFPRYFFNPSGRRVPGLAAIANCFAEWSDYPDAQLRESLRELRRRSSPVTDDASMVLREIDRRASTIEELQESTGLTNIQLYPLIGELRNKGWVQGARVGPRRDARGIHRLRNRPAGNQAVAEFRLAKGVTLDHSLVG